MTKNLTRGYIAKHLKINPETIRYYETIKLIKKPNRLPNNYRVYDQDDLQKLQFIITSKELGFSLEEIKELLSLSLDHKVNRKKIRALAEAKSVLIQQKINQLKKFKVELDSLINLCSTKNTTEPCPILMAISKKSI